MVDGLIIGGGVVALFVLMPFSIMRWFKLAEDLNSDIPNEGS